MIVYSKVNHEKPLYSVVRIDTVNDQRKDATPCTEYLQFASKKVSKGMSWPRHKHLPLERNTIGTQEAWIVMSVKIRASLYDIDETLCEELILNEGDVVIVYNAGHSLDVLEDNTILYEFKNGPYYGRDKDKVEF